MGFEQLKKMNIYLSDHNEKEVTGYLSNPDSGYPQLAVAVSDKLLTGRQVKGNGVPLDNINAGYVHRFNNKNYTDYLVMDRFDDLAILQEAFVFCWKEKNSSSKLNEFEKIAPLN